MRRYIYISLLHVIFFSCFYSKALAQNKWEYSSEVFEVVDEDPKFNGDVQKYLAEHIIYPQQALAAGTEGTVILRCTISKQGKLTNIQIQHDLGGGCTEEAVRVVKTMQDWKPGQVNGQMVTAKITLRVKFSLADYRQAHPDVALAQDTTAKMNSAAKHFQGEVFEIVEEPAAFKSDVNEFLRKNLKYPPAAIEKGIQGAVIIRAVVTADGHLVDPEVMHAIGEGCDEEALRVVKLMQDWKPGKMNGKSVNSFVTQRVRFSLQ